MPSQAYAQATGQPRARGRARKKERFEGNPDDAPDDASIQELRARTSVGAFGGGTFVLADNGPGPDCFVIFGSPSNVDFPQQYEARLSFGAFKVSPKLRAQRNAVRGRRGGFAAPRLFAFLPDKRQETFTRTRATIRGHQR